MDTIAIDTFCIIDFHGYSKASDQLVFHYASRNTAIFKNSNRSGFIISDEEDKQELIDIFKNTTKTEMLMKWFNTHSDICKFGNSDLVPQRLVCMTLILQPLDVGVQKSYE